MGCSQKTQGAKGVAGKHRDWRSEGRTTGGEWVHPIKQCSHICQPLLLPLPCEPPLQVPNYTAPFARRAANAAILCVCIMRPDHLGTHGAKGRCPCWKRERTTVKTANLNFFLFSFFPLFSQRRSQTPDNCCEKVAKKEAKGDGEDTPWDDSASEGWKTREILGNAEKRAIEFEFRSSFFLLLFSLRITYVRSGMKVRLDVTRLSRVTDGLWLKYGCCDRAWKKGDSNWEQSLSFLNGSSFFLFSAGIRSFGINVEIYL